MLTDDDFVFDGETYTVTALWQHRTSRTIFLTLDKAFPDGLKTGTLLGIGNLMFAPSQAAYTDQGKTAGLTTTHGIKPSITVPVDMVLSPLTVDAAPACGSTITNMDLSVEYSLTLALGNWQEISTQRRLLAGEDTSIWTVSHLSLKKIAIR